MPKIRPKRKSPKLDMNPMVDLAFLLVTFFMLTTTFKTEEPITVLPPNSTADTKLPSKDVLTITVGEKGRVFFSIDGQFSRSKLLEHIGRRHDINFSEEEKRQFALTSSFGMPVERLKPFLNLPPSKRKEVEQNGIPADSARNELADWLIFARVTNPRLRVAVKGDAEAKYPEIQNVINTLLENNINRFNLITELEKNPNG